MTDLLGQDEDRFELDPNKDPLDVLIGEGGKFHAPDKEEALRKLAKGKLESDHYIQILERRLDDLREDQMRHRTDADSRATLEELIDQVKQLNSTNPNANEVNQQPPLKITDIEELVSSRISQHEMSKLEQQNLRTVESKLKEHYGDSYKHVLKEQIGELGLTPEFVNDLARKHPKVLIKTLGLDAPAKKETFDGPPRSTQRTDGFSPKVQKRTWSYYQKMRKENPRLYNDPQTAKQMQKDFIELGDEFKDGDFHRFS